MPRLRARVNRAVMNPRTQWTRRKIQLLMVVGVTVVVAMVVGVAWTVLTPVDPTKGGSPARPDLEPAPSADSHISRRDRLAAESMPTATLEQAQAGPLSTEPAGSIRMPAAMTVGAAGVPSGFPQTSEGALAQLAAIDQTALTSASVRVAQEVIGGWAASGGPTAQSWSGVRAVATLLSSAGLPAGGDDEVMVSATPAMGFIKARDGDDFVIPCVDFVVELSANSQALSVAVADCQRMTWDHATARWVIGAGEEPAEPPSLWPGTQAAFDAGYEWIEVAP